MGVLPTPGDTSPEVADALANIWRDKTLEDRITTFTAMCEDVTALARAGILTQHPGFSEAQVLKELASRRHGRRFVEEVWGR